MQGEYLSNIIDIDDIKDEGLNLIYAPCGSGKSTFAKEQLKSLDDSIFSEGMLYLIDGSAGKEQLLQSKGAELDYNYWTGEEEWKLPGIRVMTYAGYATLNQKAPKYDIWERDAIIVCDELHNEIAWSKWQKDNNIHQYALGLIATRINIGGNTVVAMSATPDKIREEFGYCLNEIELHGIPRHYENENEEYYSNLSLLLNKIQPNQRGVIYITRISEILKYKALLDERGVKTAALWSKSNEKYPLSEEQKKQRQYIINHREIPKDVDVLFINKSFETSISIGNEEETQRPIDFMIIHTTDKDAQIQVRGRYRNDLKNLYLHKADEEDVIELSLKWLLRKLYKKDRDELCAELGFKDKNGRLLKWPSIKAKLKRNGYIITEKRTSEERYVIIEEI
ncbi:MAG: hypothetical protein E7413_04595 [Ruminococcaceae bacterium]|nr:hypothetical protein [Oscillospiraceae bacterium]